MTISRYYDPTFIKEEVQSGNHREVIGGKWDEIGNLQFEFLKAQGLKPESKFLDVGCGSLRGGIHFVQYLNSGNYYGIDINESLLEAGYNVELAKAGIQDRQPRENLACVSNFDCSQFNCQFDYAIAQSVFTHLLFNHIRQCLEKIVDVMAPGGVFFATFFELPSDRPHSQSFTHRPSGIITHATEDPYHYKVSDFDYACEGLPWRVKYIGEWNHPRDQHMISFVKGS
ncbi:MAG: class I SAM-dependent methyltransferase [Thainema sp.]